MDNILKKVWNIVSIILVGLIVVLAVLTVGVRVVGFDVYTVLSGSMEPEYPVGSLIYVKDVDYKTLDEGDVITFMISDDLVATHRIVEVIPDEEDSEVIYYRTKGDANDSVDGSLVHYMNIIGSPVFKIPLLGYLSSYIQNPPGMYIAIALGIVLIGMVFLPDLLFADDSKKKDKKVAKDAANNDEV